MSDIAELFDNNRRWAERMNTAEPGFFNRLARQQAPRYLWIGCADSRVPANEIVGLLPGELFVHRNVANVVVHTDLNCLSVLQFAVDVLKVQHVIVCGADHISRMDPRQMVEQHVASGAGVTVAGIRVPIGQANQFGVIETGHYGCGGIEAAWKKTSLGLIDNWLRHVQDVAEQHADQFLKGVTDAHATERLAELNVLSQVANVCRTTIVIDAWRRGQPLSVHGVIYGLHDGRLRDLGLTVARDGALPAEYAHAIGGLGLPGESKHR